MDLQFSGLAVSEDPEMYYILKKGLVMSDLRICLSVMTSDYCYTKAPRPHLKP